MSGKGSAATKWQQQKPLLKKINPMVF